MTRTLAAVVLMLGLVYGQTAQDQNSSLIVLPNPKLLRCQTSDCDQVWLENSSKTNAIFPKQVRIDMNQGCLYGITALYDKSVPLDDIRAAINARYGKWTVPGLGQVWRVEPEKFAIQLGVNSKKNQRRNLGEAGTTEAIYIAYGGKSACSIPWSSTSG